VSGDSIARLVRDKRVLVCCGAGGVGKTTTSASIALAASRAGQRVVVITIDPSRRLAETMGIAPNAPAPVELSASRLRALGVEPPGTLSAWILNPQIVSDHVVHTVSDQGADVRALLQNRVYQNVSTLIAGMQEYAAVEALHGFIVDDRYDLVVLDTPPSGNALRFLEAPARANAFLDRRAFGLFLPTGGSAMFRLASQVIQKVLDFALGAADRQELQQFLVLFEGVLGHLNHNQAEMRAFFQGPDVSFLLVTSPAREAVEEAFHFEQKIRDMGASSCGYILNRSLAWATDLPYPDPRLLPPDAPDAARSGVRKLAEIAGAEPERARRDAALAAELRKRAGQEGLVSVLPRLTRDASDLEALVELAAVFQEHVGRRAPSELPPQSMRPLSSPPGGALPPTGPWFPKAKGKG
jgi:anion-transporting  ArsA/GET3 family ATPase